MADVPIRLFHGTADNISLLEHCQAYVRRLQEAGKDVTLREYTGAHHGFDNPGSPVRVLLERDSPAGCALVERTAGQIVNRDTGSALTNFDTCVVRQGVTVGYDEAAQQQAVEEVTRVLQQVFQLTPAP